LEKKREDEAVQEDSAEAFLKVSVEPETVFKLADADKRDCLRILAEDVHE